ncbi:putative nucleotidyltransferase component of viral defense system [Povalibacter uvarum]|uniref:Putative nucleotidyltransferase component of viral defense system n=1 Tax=Povalibacter uvarum TaxID=732238 RepID=A0A841HQ66_9GAMM|nr:nucleotidyl transferase AbiEii/AbiGii toxin family protein [Povalibacter uvarum]MBB6095006.1 putative nucleotidyltransferase component of viral defense system [Povalibacter uvarum]
MTYDPAEIREAQAYFGFARPVLIEKDWHIIRAMSAIAATDAAPFQLIFSGGTCLARAHKLIRRMSEDVDFKIVPIDASAVSKSQRRRQLADLRDKITASLHAAGFPIDPADGAQLQSRDDNRYTVYQLQYATSGEEQAPLRSTIQVELNYATLRKASVELPVASFVAEAFGRAPEIFAIPCVTVEETAAEKLISLTRRTAMEIAGLSRTPDPTLVRHVYDLHITRQRYDNSSVVALAKEIMSQDAEEFRNQFPAYRDDPVQETRRALAALEKEDVYAHRYAEFVQLMVYGERPSYVDAMQTVASLTKGLLASVSP